MNKNLRSLRKLNNMSQQDLADRIFVSRSLISLWESGRRVPDRYNVERLANIFGVQPTEIVPDKKYIYANDDEAKELIFELDEFKDVKTDPEKLEICLAKLSTKEHKIFMDRYFNGKSCKTIADDFKIESTNVRVTLLRIRTKLKKYLEEDNNENEK